MTESDRQQAREAWERHGLNERIQMGRPTSKLLVPQGPVGASLTMPLWSPHHFITTILPFVGSLTY